MPILRTLSSLLVLIATVVGQSAASPKTLATFGIQSGTVQQLSLPHRADVAFAVDCTLGAFTVTLDLWPVDMRSPGFQVFLRGVGGLMPVAIEAPPTLRGAVRDVPGSRVAATLVGGQLRASIVLPSATWTIQPVDDRLAGPAAEHVAYEGAAVLPAAGHCQVGGRSTTPATAFLDSTYAAELALEADFPLFQLNAGNPTAVQTEVFGIVNAVSAIYLSDFNVTFTVGQLIVDTIPDPYTSSVAGILLSQLRSYWNANYAAVPRDLVHLFTGRNLAAVSGGQVGVAYIGALCSQTDGYGLSQTRWTANYALRVALTAHELGHNFGATHCDATPGCSIMCSTVGGCAGTVTSFGPAAAAEVQAVLQASACLALQPTVPQIQSAAPALVATVAPPMVTLTGSGFLGTTQVVVGGQTVTQGLHVENDTRLRFTPPPGLALGLQTVQVTNPAGTSNSSLLVYQASDPCRVVGPASVAAGAALDWRVGGWPGDPAYLLCGFFDSTSTFLGWPVLDAPILVWMGVLDGRGLADVQITVPMLGLPGPFAIYAQALDQNGTSPTLRSTSAAFRTILW